jgi:hypothetical protein
MLSRCTNPNFPKHKCYGARGIGVCDRWRSYENFLADMGRKPSPLHSIDRIDNDGNYEPGNCRWATSLEQARNKRNTMHIDMGGRIVCLREACEILGLSYNTAQRRLNALGWSVEDTLSIPAGAIRGNRYRRHTCA